MKHWTLQDVAEHWDRSPAYDAQNAKIDSYLRRFHDSAPLFTIPAGARVLDMDCRTGKGTSFFHEAYPDATFTCMAMAPSFVERAKARLHQEGIAADVHLMTRLPLPFPEEHFDVILCYETLEHVPWPEQFIAECARLLAPGGTLVLTTPNVLWEPVHWLSARLKLDHGEGPHRMVPRREILRAFRHACLQVQTERTFVLIPAGPAWLLSVGRALECLLPEQVVRILALRRTFICHKPADYWWEKLRTEIVEPGLETQCGTPVGLSNGTLTYAEHHGNLLLTRTNKPDPVPQAAYEGCAARDCPYPLLNRTIFGRVPANWLSGVVEHAYTGYASDEVIRRNGASGGILTATLIHLLETGRITGAVCLQMGKRVPWRAEPVIARTREEILSCAQSVYSVTPVNTILSDLENEEGPLAYVGLPDQVAAIRKLQHMQHPSVHSIRYVLGPYVGTQMNFEAIRSFLRSHGVHAQEDIVHLRYRAGEWPGHLEIKVKDGRTLRMEKFYYNYLIPFYVARSSLQLVDFTNELTDLSVGDAWSPRFEARRGGYSVVLARTPRAVELLEEMQQRSLLTLEEIRIEDALDMHGHMLDFKKRGSFIRNEWKERRPAYGYAPARIPASRRLVEWVLWALFTIGGTRMARRGVELLPLTLVGPVFNRMRLAWKAASRPTKRKGLKTMTFIVQQE